jgi:hypothetical protein
MNSQEQPETAPTSPLKAAMRAWSEVNPEEAAARLAARQRHGERRKLVARFSELIGEEMIAKAGERLDEMLDATAPVVVGKGQGEAEIQMVPDNKIRLEAVRLVAAYNEGTPVQRQVIMHGDCFRDLEGEKRALLMSIPAMQETLAELEEELAGGSAHLDFYESPAEREE